LKKGTIHTELFTFLQPIISINSLVWHSAPGLLVAAKNAEFVAFYRIWIVQRVYF
ncbi:hypothetical protein LDENG_00118900, partial [Lucifuga dentata]